MSTQPSIVTIEQLDALIAAQFEAKAIKGAAVAIVANGEVVWSNGYGFANSETQLSATADTPFMLGSISKSVTGVAIMHAVENGHLALDTDINNYLDFTVSNPQLVTPEPITLRHIATHTSGIVDNDWVYANSYQIGDPSVSLEAFLRDYLLADGRLYSADKNFEANLPGAVSEYSNIATGLAGQVLHTATGTRLDKYAQRHIFAPLGMRNTGWFLSEFADTTQIAQPYALGNRPHPHYGYPTWPEGQLRSSANDLARLLAMVTGGGQFEGKQILRADTVAEMLVKQQFAGLESITGEGIFWSYTRNGMLGHNGGDVGVATAMYFNPETNIGAVVLTNANVPRAVEPLFNTVHQIVLSDAAEKVIDSAR